MGRGDGWGLSSAGIRSLLKMTACILEDMNAPRHWQASAVRQHRMPTGPL